MEDVKTQNDTFTNLERLEELITYWPQVVVNRINPPGPVNHPSHYAQYPLEVVNYPQTKDLWASDFTEERPFKRLGLLSSPSV